MNSHDCLTQDFRSGISWEHSCPCPGLAQEGRIDTTKGGSSSHSWQRALGEKCTGDLVGVSRCHTLGVSCLF